MQFPWTLSKKILTVAHRDCPKSSTEKLVLSYKGVNWELTLYYYRKDGRIMERRKRHSRISSRRWEMHEISAERFRSSLGLSVHRGREENYFRDLSFLD